MFHLGLTVALYCSLLWPCSVLSFHRHDDGISCEEARVKCFYRVDCSDALTNYLVGCSAVLQNNSMCPEVCQHALIALTSTEVGQKLMMCECKDAMCEEAKAKVEVCRPHVIRATRNESVVSCTLAHIICAADNECYTALKYYNNHCKSMFQGKKCSGRCKNSINILRRQEKAAKLNTCVCDGREDYDCVRIRTNMDRLCYHKDPEVLMHESRTNNVVSQTPSDSGGNAVTSLPFLSLVISWSLMIT